jgi:Fic family protein
MEKFLSVKEISKIWNISERSVRNYCSQGKIDGAVLQGKTWFIPEDAVKPERANKKKDNRTLLEVLNDEHKAKISGGIYHKVQIELTYNSNHMEGSRLTHDQTRFIFETNTIGMENSAVKVDDIVETANHFRCIDMIIENAKRTLSEPFIKELHRVLKSGTTDSRQSWFAVGDYKKLPNEIGGHETVKPKDVHEEIKKLLATYNQIERPTFDDILDLHYRFECIHPFQDGNGRVGRLIMFKELLKWNYVPFIIDEDLKYYYYRGLREWPNERGFLRDTCLAAQDQFKAWLDYFEIQY